ncbi:MAG: 3-hydroxyacyl-CoA dehydrogenase NAD-binding domain-containing protein [Pseudomonadota bacterium]
MKKAVVIVGGGIMGRDIAAIFIAAGWKTQIVARDEGKWPQLRRSLQASVEQLGAVVHPVIHLRADIGDVDWDGVVLALEVVPEQLELKRKVFAALDASAPANVVIGSNSSSLRITDIAADLAGAARMANTHFFQPAHIVPLIEIAKGDTTSSRTMETLHDIFYAVGRAPVRVNSDLPGFLANRMQHALMREAFAVIDSGLASAEDVDTAVQFGFGFRYVAAGPMLIKEFAGFDTQHAAATAIYPTLCNDSAPGKTLSGLVEQKHFGVKSRKGLRNWTPESIEEERGRYESALMKAAGILWSSLGFKKQQAPREN